MTGPPRVAVWLVAHLASRYSRDSLLGDLWEEYSQGRSRGWYWKQVAIAIGLAACNALHADRWLSMTRWLLRAMAAVLWMTALVLLVRHSEHPGVCSADVSSLLLVCLGALCLTASMLWSRRRDVRRSKLRKGLLLLSATVALGAATLTWAGTTAQASRIPSVATCRSAR